MKKAPVDSPVQWLRNGKLGGREGYVLLAAIASLLILYALFGGSASDSMGYGGASFTSSISGTHSLYPVLEQGAAPGPEARTVLITGGAGFVGRHFSHRLCTTGWHVTIVDTMQSESAILPDKWPQHLQCPPGTFHFIQQDCRAFFRTARSIRNWDLFLHLAAVVGGRATIEGNPIGVAEDLSIDAEAFGWAVDDRRKSQPGRMVFFSSSAAYPIKHQYPDSGVLLKEPMIDLTNTQQDIGFPDLSYGWAKLTGEYLGLLAHESKQLKVVTYRPMSGYGEDQNEAYPFKAILKRALAQENPISIWSNATRDFMYIEDIVDCVLETMEDVDDGSPINLGTGVATSFADLAVIMAEEVGYAAQVTVASGKPAGVAYRVGDPVNMKSKGCTVRTSIREGVRKAIRYMRSLETGSSFDSEGGTNAAAAQEGSTAPTASGNLRKPEGTSATAEPASRVPVPPPPAAPKPKLSPRSDYRPFSSHYCMGGSQQFEGWKLQHTPSTFPEADDPRLRVCEFRNVCWKAGQLLYYEDSSANIPARAKIGAFGGQMLSTDYVEEFGLWSPTVVQGARPEAGQGVEHLWQKTYMLSGRSYYDNIGHTQIDMILPTFAAARQWRVPLEDIRVLFLGCNRLFKEGFKSPHSTVTSRELCGEHTANYVSLYLKHLPVNLEEQWLDKTYCMDRVIVGHTSTYSLRVQDVERADTMRWMTNTLASNLGIDTAAEQPFTEHSIMVLLKHPGFNLPAWPSICEDVKAQMAVLGPSIPVRCFDPVMQTVQEQVTESRRSTVIIAEHGTLSYGALYAREGTTLLSVGRVEVLKEVQILLAALHFRTFYMVSDQKEELPQYLELVLSSASTTLGIPFQVAREEE